MTPVYTLAHANRHEHPSIFKIKYLYFIKSNIWRLFKKIHPETGQMVQNNHPISAHLAQCYLETHLEPSLKNLCEVTKRFKSLNLALYEDPASHCRCLQFTDHMHVGLKR